MLYVKFDNFEDISVVDDAKDHGMAVLIRDENVYFECERCRLVEKIPSPCEFIARSSKQRTNFNKGYELCDMCFREVEFATTALKTEKLPN